MVLFEESGLQGFPVYKLGIEVVCGVGCTRHLVAESVLYIVLHKALQEEQL